MSLPINIVSEFEDITQYPLSALLNDYSDFILNDRINIFGYYSGEVSTPKQESFDLLIQLLQRCEELMSAVRNHKNSFENAAFWELLDFITQMQSSLQTVDNSFKWMRSALSKNEFTSTIERDDFLRQNETLELFSARFGSNDRDNDWKTIAFRNDLIEEAYTPQGGTTLVVSINKRRLTGSVKSVVDTLQGKKIYGIDLDQRIQFDEEQSDLVALSYDNTVRQAVSILSSLKQGDTPEFPLEGIQSAMVANNRASIPYAMLMRQLFATYKADDTLAGLTITDIKNTTDSLAIEYSISTVLGGSLIEETLL